MSRFLNIFFLIIFLVITQEKNLRIEYVQLSFLKDVIDLSYFSHFFRTLFCRKEESLSLQAEELSFSLCIF